MQNCIISAGCSLIFSAPLPSIGSAIGVYRLLASASMSVSTFGMSQVKGLRNIHGGIWLIFALVLDNGLNFYIDSPHLFRNLEVRVMKCKKIMISFGYFWLKI